MKKILRSFLAFVLCFSVLFSVMLCFSVEASAEESSNPRHVVMLRFGGLNDTIRGSDIRPKDVPELNDYGILDIVSTEKWLKPFLDDGNLFGYWNFTGMGNSWMPDGYASYLWDDWDSLMADYVWNHMGCSLFGDRVGPGSKTINYFNENAEIRSTDIVTIINIGNFQGGYDFYYGNSVVPSNSFYTDDSAIPYHFDSSLLRSAAEEEHNHVFRGESRTIEEHTEILVGQEYLAWERTQEVLSSWPSNFNVISVYTHDGLDEYRSGADTIRKLLGIQYLKDIQDSGYFEIHYLDVIEFLTGLFPAIQSTSSSAELQELLGSESSFGADSAPELPITQVISHGGQSIDAVFDWRDFLSSSSEYNHDLAKFSMGLCAATYAGNIESVYNGFGFGDFHTLNLEDNVYSGDTIKAYLARKILADGTELISITGCGTQSEEWAQYLKFFNELTIPALQSENGVYTNFQYACGNLYAEIVDYCGGDLSGKKFHLTGHSRGAAVTNLTSYVLNQVVGSENVYSYTFATPNTYLAGHKAPEASNIFNIVDGGDIVTQLPPSGSKSGQTYGYNTEMAFAMSLTGLPNLVYGVTQHMPQNYMQLLASGEAYEQFYYQSWRWVNIHCATDVKVLNSEGEVVASITDNVVDPDNLYFISTNVDGEKTILLPSGQEFTIQVTGRADRGSMEYSLYTLSKSALTQEIAPSTIRFDDGDVFIANLGENPSKAELKSKSYLAIIAYKLGTIKVQVVILIVLLILLFVVTIFNLWVTRKRNSHK